MTGNPTGNPIGNLQRRNLATLAVLVGVIGGMGGLVVASVPLYRLFCQVTGYGGTTRTADAAPDTVLKRTVTIQFDAGVNSALPWRFQPVQRRVDVKLGERKLAFYRAVNNSDAPVTGTATFNVTPAKAGPYFNKIDCFCFTEQTLEPGQSVDMGVSFFVDPDMAKDRNLNDVTEITLSYTFFKTEKKEGKRPETSPRASARKGGAAFDLALKQ